MSNNKLDPQQAFNLVESRRKHEAGKAPERKGIEDRFGEDSARAFRERPVWKTYVILTFAALATAALMIGLGVFYWFMVNKAEPVVADKGPADVAPAAISKEQAKEMVENNLTSFLAASNNDERARYIFEGKRAMPALKTYYITRGIRDVPLWKIERFDQVKLSQGELWVVVYLDLDRKQHAASFQRVGDDFLLHWSAMKAFSEMTWEKFIVERPAGPLVMRCYIRQYTGVWPIGIAPKKYHCFLVEDYDGLFSELAVMKLESSGSGQLRKLTKDTRHPVTLNLGYAKTSPTDAKERIMIHSLKHLRWQRMSMDARVQD